MSNLDTPNKEDKSKVRKSPEHEGASQIEHPLMDEELLNLAGEFKEYMHSASTDFPDITGKSMWDKLYYSGMLPGILRFFMARENHFEDFLKVVGEEDELDTILRPLFWHTNSREEINKFNEIKGLIKSRDQRIALEAREQGVIDFCKDIKHKVDLLFIAHPPETIVLPWEQTVRPIIYKYAATQSQKEE